MKVTATHTMAWKNEKETSFRSWREFIKYSSSGLCRFTCNFKEFGQRVCKGYSSQALGKCDEEGEYENLKATEEKTSFPFAQVSTRQEEVLGS